MMEGSMDLRDHMRHVRDVYFTDADSVIGFVYFSIMGAMGLFMLLAIPVIPASAVASGSTFHPFDAVVLIMDMIAGLVACLAFLSYTGSRERDWESRDATDAGDDVSGGISLRESLAGMGVPVRDDDDDGADGGDAGTV